MLYVIKTIVRLVVILFIISYFYQKKKGEPLDLQPILNQWVIGFEEKPLLTIIVSIMGIVILLVLLF